MISKISAVSGEMYLSQNFKYLAENMCDLFLFYLLWTIYLGVIFRMHLEHPSKVVPHQRALFMDEQGSLGELSSPNLCRIVQFADHWQPKLKGPRFKPLPRYFSSKLENCILCDLLIKYYNCVKINKCVYVFYLFLEFRSLRFVLLICFTYLTKCHNQQ